MRKYSKQREEILSVLKESNSHPTAEEIYNILKEKGSTVSKGTVYRNLKELTNEHIIMIIPINDGPDRYDYINESHNHVICSKCGKVIDFKYGFENEKLKNYIFTCLEMDVDFSRATFSGICLECKNKL